MKKVKCKDGVDGCEVQHTHEGNTHMARAFDQPQDIDAAGFVFPARVSHLMPPYDAIPDEFKRTARSKWAALVSEWFFRGITGADFQPKDGVDKKKALRHVDVILRSFEPKHEHKEAACAYLLSLWFDRVLVNGKQVAP